MKLLRLAPENTKFPFMRFRRVSYPFSAVLSIISVVLFLTVGMNFGIDFSGGTLMEVQAKSGTADLSYIRDLSDHLGLGDLEVQGFGSPADASIRFGMQPGGDVAQQTAVEKVKTALGDSYDFRRVEVVGPRVSGELVQSGTLGVVLSILAVLSYLWFRFEWQFAVGAIIATMHDLLLTVGFFFDHPARVQHHLDRGDLDHRRLFAERNSGGARPHPRNDAQIQENANRPTHRHLDQRRAAAHPHDRDDRVPGAFVARRLRRPGHPLLLARHDVGHFRRHLFLDLHLLADVDLSWLAQ